MTVDTPAVILAGIATAICVPAVWLWRKNTDNATVFSIACFLLMLAMYAALAARVVYLMFFT